MITIFFVIVLIFSVIVHEIAHGYVALRFGDTTARDAGRLTLNPIPHLDLFGSILFPLLLATAGAPVFGWAKPVPVSPRLSRRADFFVSLAGPASNLCIAALCAIVFRVLAAMPNPSEQVILFAVLISVIVQVNVSLAVFNLLPVPPLDGSGVLFSLLPPSTLPLQQFMHRFGFAILLVLIFTGLNFLNPIMASIYRILLGGA